MRMFEGALVEVWDEQWSQDCDEPTELYRTIAVWGRAASGRWLTRDDAQCSFSHEDIDVLEENDGSVFVSDEGEHQVVDRLAKAFPGADVRYYPDDGEEHQGELDVAGIPPVFEVAFSWSHVPGADDWER